ncbi:MAG: hypothetical protein ACI9WU_001415 [Myxococcota bacterium]|jgi:hypothetical protein
MAPNRFDLIFFPEDLRKVAPLAGEAVLRYLATERVGLPYAEAIAETWVEVYCKPGPSAHTPFVKGGWGDDTDVMFEEMMVRFGEKPIALPFGMEGETTFYVEFRGCLFEDSMGKFKSKFKDILHVRPASHTRKFEGLPEHLVVPEDEQPIDKRKKKGPRGGVAGTRVEEW